ncbi:hypothetical protein [Lewinella sp. JB7]|uniref:hypothetical protein n=1 Tax=Lewinella sp. JB7 TaxID=2962887 RepID=UPI0020C9C5B3|nr:hypothetical protein [Lewinella sp. JB7]MCP9237080.1 hypothetical protein [Lewinella sp. JB7]
MELTESVTEIRKHVQHIDNVRTKGESRPLTEAEIDKLVTRCLEIVLKIRKEPSERYQRLRFYSEIDQLIITAHYPTDRAMEWNGRITEEDVLEERFQHTILGFLQDHDPNYGGQVWNHIENLQELELFSPDVFSSMHLDTQTYEDWELGKFKVDPSFIRTRGKVWGLLVKLNSFKRSKEIGKKYSVTFLPESEFQKIEGKQQELSEQYVQAVLSAYRERHAQNTGHLPPDHPERKRLLELYDRVFKDRDFAGLMTFTRGGYATTPNEAKDTSGPRKWQNETYDWWDYIASSNGLKFYHYAPAELLRTMKVKFEPGDAEALYRFTKELVPQATHVHSNSQNPGDRSAEYRFVLKSFINNEPGTGFTTKQYEAVAKAVAARWGRKKAVSSYRSDRTRYTRGRPWITSPLIDGIIKELEDNNDHIDWEFIRQIRPRKV